MTADIVTALIYTTKAQLDCGKWLTAAYERLAVCTLSLPVSNADGVDVAEWQVHTEFV